RRPASSLLGDDVDGGLLGTRGGAVDAHVLAQELGRVVVAVAAVGLDEATGPGIADLAVVEVLLAPLAVGIDVGDLLLEPLLEGLALTLLVVRGAEAFSG